MRKEFNSQRILLVHQHGRRFIVLEHQYGRRDVMWKRSIALREEGQWEYSLLLKPQEIKAPYTQSVLQIATKPFNY